MSVAPRRIPRLVSRREILRHGTIAGVTLLVPSTVACVGKRSEDAGAGALPTARPGAWDPVTFNRLRGSAGAIPEEYMAEINGEDGVTEHLGKHLPFVPASARAPLGMLALMWGDPSLGYARHPNAPVSPDEPTGHWYDWIRLRRSIEGPAEELESRFSAWPVGGAGDNGRYAALQGTDPADDEGRNTIYLAVLPSGVQPGEWVRVHAHCLTHGEYVDYVRVSA
jgi:hypothetical protein